MNRQRKLAKEKKGAKKIAIPVQRFGGIVFTAIE